MRLGELEAAMPGASCRSRQERVKDWTKRGLIPAERQIRSGTGFRKNYGEDAVAIASVLEMLATIGCRVRGKSKFIGFIAKDANLIMALKEIVDAYQITED